MKGALNQNRLILAFIHNEKEFIGPLANIPKRRKRTPGHAFQWRPSFFAAIND